MMKRISITIDEALLAQIDVLAAEAGISRVAWMRKALEEQLRRLKIADLERRDREGYAKQPAHPDEFAWNR